MHKIREFRTQSNLTQKELAELMHTTQQTIGRWENGNSEPSISNLRDLAYVLKTTVGTLLGDPWAPKLSSRYHLMLKENDNGMDGFWGNLGILPAKGVNSIWYPITVGTSEVVPRLVEDETPFQFETLNNKLVFVNPKNIKRFVTLDDAADAFPGDWIIEWHESGYESLELFEAFEAYIDERYCETSKNLLSENLRATIEKIITDNELDEEKILKLTSGIRIFFNDGTTESYTLSNFDSVDNLLFSTFISDDFPKTISIIDDDFSMYIPTESISMIEFPLLKVTEALGRLNPMDPEEVEKEKSPK